MSVRPVYSEEQVATAVLAVKANRGFVKPVADKMGLKSQTLGRWVDGSRRADGAASRAAMVHKAEQNLLDGFLELAVAARQVALEKIGSASAYQATLIGGISYDKYLLGTGRPTSRTESLKARYVEGDSLRSIASRVVDVPALPLGLARGERTPKVAGGEGRGSYLTQSPQTKEPRKRTKKIAQNTSA